MIFPESKLIYWCSWGLMPLVTVAWMIPSSALICLGLVLLFFAFATFDLYQVSRCKKNSQCLCSTTQLNFRTGQIKTISLDIIQEKASPIIASLEYEGFISLSKDRWHFNESNIKHHIDLEVQSHKRGRAKISRIAIGSISPFKWWRRETLQNLNLDFSIFPDIYSKHPDVTALVHQAQLGSHRSHPNGQGREFDRLRPYQHGDTWADIHWKATAKRRAPISKIYRQERRQDLMILIDISRTSSQSWIDHGEQIHIIDKSITTALWIIRLAETQGDRAGLLVYDDQVRVELKPNDGKHHFQRCLKALHDIRPSDKAADHREMFSALSRLQNKRCLAICLSQLQDSTSKESFLKNIDMVTKKHLLLVAHLRSPMEAPVFHGPELSSDHDIASAIAGHLNWQDQKQFERNLQQKGADSISSSPETFTLYILKKYLDIKRRTRL